jgi:hypothetical protein
MFLVAIEAFFVGAVASCVDVVVGCTFRTVRCSVGALMGGVVFKLVTFIADEDVCIFLLFALSWCDSGVEHGKSVGEYALRDCGVSCDYFYYMGVVLDFDDVLYLYPVLKSRNLVFNFGWCLFSNVPVQLSYKYSSFRA